MILATGGKDDINNMEKKIRFLPLNLSFAYAKADMEKTIIAKIVCDTDTKMEFIYHLTTGNCVLAGLNRAEILSKVHVCGNKRNPPAWFTSMSTLNAEINIHSSGTRKINAKKAKIKNTAIF